MKRILITGANSYIGTSFEEWISQWSKEYQVDTTTTRHNEWKKIDFGNYDSILHVAGIAHQNIKENQETIYYKINRDLAIQIAKKAKKDKAKQFLFMSSIIVYGNSDSVEEIVNIKEDTTPKPKNFYGKSKLEAEIGIKELQDKDFQVAILRPPMIYGKKSKGNYPLLSRFAKNAFVFPQIDNKRSILYVKNLCEFLRLLIDNNDSGMFYPQNNEYISTIRLVSSIRELSGKKLYKTKMLNVPIQVASRHIDFLNKIFGSLFYEQSMSVYKQDYNIYTFKESLMDSEGFQKQTRDLLQNTHQS